MSLYLLHFSKPYHHASHYLGYSTTEAGIESRIDYHRKGRGSRLLAAVARAGIEVELVRVWKVGERGDERRLKGHSSGRYCPRCNPVGWERRGRLD